MKYMKINLYSSIGTEYTKWSVDDTIKYKIIIDLCFDPLPYFSVQVNNIHFNERNIFVAFIRSLEHETIGMQKYTALKEHLYKLGMWQKL